MINLPSSGTNNWGAAVNNILNNLDKRLISLEKQNNNFDSNLYAIKQIGCMTSGVADGMYGTLTYSYDNDNNKYSVTISDDMAVYVGGSINTYFQPVIHFLGSTTFSITKNGYYYVYLRYANSTNTFDIAVQETLSFDSNSVLIDNIKVNNTTHQVTSFGKHFVASKTIAQHRDEQLRRYVEYTGALVPTNTATANHWTPSFDFLSDIHVYADGYYDGNLETPHSTTAVNFSTADKYYLYDSSTTTSPYLQTATTTSAYDLDDGRIFRVLLTVDGSFIIQRANTSVTTSNVTSSALEGSVRNTAFNNQIITNNISFAASDWVEIQRICVTDNQVYTYSPVNNGYIAGNTGNYYVPTNTSIYLGDNATLFGETTYTNGIKCNITDNSESIWLDGGKYDLNSIVLTDHFSHHGATAASITLNHDTNIGLRIDEDGLTFFTTSSTYAISQDHVTLYTSGYINIGSSSTTSVHIQNKDIEASKITLSDGMYMSSDRRLKENILPVTEDYLAVINDVPVCKYTYINSDDPQIGIIAQDLEKYIGENYFIDNSEEYKKLRENKLIYILWKALQEESAARQKLEARVNMLMGD